jgi:hypothetical protein
VPAALRDAAAFANRDDVLTAEIGSLGTMTARGAARVYAALLGPVDGTGLVSPGRRDAMARVAFTGPDQVMGFETRWAFGYSPDHLSDPGTPRPAFGMVGANGSAAWADVPSGVAAAVLRNGPAPGGDFTAATRIDTLLLEEY